MAFKDNSEALLSELFYPSESDEPVEYISIDTEKHLPFSEDDIRDFLDTANQPIEMLDLATFWDFLTTTKAWYIGEEILRVEKFSELKTMMETQLVNLQGFRVGEIEIAIYVLGENQAGQIEGIKTLSIET